MSLHSLEQSQAPPMIRKKKKRKKKRKRKKRREPVELFPELLFPYQLDGVHWMIEREKDRGGILADEQGLGKTVQIMGLLKAAWVTAAADSRRPSTIPLMMI